MQEPDTSETIESATSTNATGAEHGVCEIDDPLQFPQSAFRQNLLLENLCDLVTRTDVSLFECTVPFRGGRVDYLFDRDRISRQLVLGRAHDSVCTCEGRARARANRQRSHVTRKGSRDEVDTASRRTRVLSGLVAAASERSASIAATRAKDEQCETRLDRAP